METVLSGQPATMSHLRRLVIFVLIAYLQLTPLVHGALREEVKSKAGDSVSLPCIINRDECGDFHSIKWYKENRRVFVYSPIADFAKAEGELLDRGQLSIDDDRTNAKLHVKDVVTSDEGEYKCEITFLDITKNCPVVQLVKLTTLAAPKYINISLPSDGTARDMSSGVVGPFNEGQEVRLLCEAGGGKPIPRVNWYNGTELLTGKASSFEESDGTGTGRNEVRIRLSRGDLGNQFVCKAENEAVDQPLQTSVQIDVNLRPESTEIVGADNPVDQGNVVSLLCRTRGARPAAVITWYNGSRPFAEQPAGKIALQDDNTYETQSRISFIASRFENGEFITCESNNQVIIDHQEEPHRASITLQVLYPPVVDISQTDIETNETSEVMIYCTYEANPTQLKAVRWYRNGQLLDTSNRTRFDGATVDQPSLVIKSVNRADSGRYSCMLENTAGSAESINSAELNVLYKPSVSLRMNPQSPINELSKRNVTLFCDVLAGNPEHLTSVRWYMDGVLLKQLPMCDDDDGSGFSGTSSLAAGSGSGSGSGFGSGSGDSGDETSSGKNDLCDIDPSKLLLEHVSKLFHGNFSCEATNRAGWSERSEESPLEVYYPPGPAFIQKDIDRVIKGESITLTCNVAEPGRPAANRYIWKRGGHRVNYVDSYNWTISPVTLETEANISCVAVNQVGPGEPDFITVEVFAPPSFIVRLPPYTGAMAEVANFSLKCQVECSPLCDIVWLKDGAYIASDDERYTISKGEKPPNFAKNDFESVTSTLNFNMDKWPTGKLDRIIDNANYTCQSTGNLVSPQGVSSTTYFRVEYPPENIEISDRLITVDEGSSSGKILCTAEAYPEASYMWQHSDEVVATDNMLFFDHGISRNQAGEYTCVAQNRHGSTKITTKIDVLYKPECIITQSEDDGDILLACVASANPDSVAFGWRKGNETLVDFSVEGIVSTVRIQAFEDNFGMYSCYVNNSIGAGIPCEADVQGIGLLKEGDSAKLIIIIAVIAACVVALIILVAVIVIFCRKQKPGDKFNNHQDLEEREKMLSRAGLVSTAGSGGVVVTGGRYCPSYEVSPSSFRYYSSSVEYLTDVAKHSPDSGYPDGDHSNGDPKGFYENLPFHGAPLKQGLTAASTSSYVQSTGGVLPGVTAYSTSSSSGRGSGSGSGGSSGSNYHQSLPRHFMRAGNGGNGNGLPPGSVMQPSIALTTGAGNCSKSPAQASSTTAGRTMTSSVNNRGLPYSTSGLAQYQQPLRPQHLQQPIRTVSYYSTLSASNGGGPNHSRGGNGIYPDASQDVMQPPRQFDSYYYHPATLNHSQTSVPLYSGAYPRQRPNGDCALPPPAPSNGQTNRVPTSKKPQQIYSDLTPVGVPQYPTTSTSGGRARPPSSSNGASTEYAVLQFIPQNVGKEIDV